MTLSETTDIAVIAAVLAHWYGVTSGAASVLAVLYAGGGSVDPLALAEASGCGAATVVRMHMPALRAALCDDAIDWEPGRGYSLTDAGRTECRKALALIGAEIMGAAA